MMYKHLFITFYPILFKDFQINYLIDRNFQVSRMIVDEADMEIEMATDPFIEAGIEVPASLPYQGTNQQEDSFKKVVGEEIEASSMAEKINKIASLGGRSRLNSSTASVKTAMFSRTNSVYASRRSEIPKNLSREKTFEIR